MQMNLRDWSFLILLSLIWGGSFFFVEIALLDVSPLVTVLGRVGGAALILLVVLKLSGKSLPRKADIWLTFFIMGAINNAIPFMLIVSAQTEITSSLASIFNATTPLFTVVLAHYLSRDEKITPLKIFGITLGFFGVVMMIGFDALQGIDGSVWAQLAILLSSTAYGLSAIYGRRFKGQDPMVLATGQVTCAALLLLPFTLVFGFPDGLIMPSLNSLLAIFALASLCTAFAYVLYFRVLATSGATNLMLVTFLVPVSAISLGVIFLGESLKLYQISGMVLIFTGLLTIDGRIFGKIRNS